MPKRKLNKYKEDTDSLALAKSAREFAKLLGNGKGLKENISKIPPYYTLGNGRSLFDEAYQSKLGAPHSWYLENENKVKQKLIKQADRIENARKTFVFGGNKRKKAALGDYEYLAPTIVSAQGRRIPDLSAYNRVIGPVPTIDRSFPDISKIEGKPIVTQVVNPTPSTIAGTQPIVKPYTPSLLERYGLNKGDVVASGIQLAGNLASSLINQAAIDKLGFTPIHTMTVAEAPVKFDTNYDINPQVDELREMEAANEREIRDNTASSQNVVGRTIGSRFRTNRGYNELYGHKLNQQAAMKNAEVQNRQGVYQRNTDRLQRNLYRDEAYNVQGEDNLRNTKSTLTGQNWSNFAQQAAGSLIGAYNRGQQRISDSNSLGFLLASNPNFAKLFMNNNSLINRIFRTARRMQGIYG